MATDIYYNNMKVSYMGQYPAVYLPSHHRASSSGMTYIHVLVAENILGRFLSQEECVHHVDEDKNNYNTDNIWVFATNADHACYHEAIRNDLDFSLFKIKGVYHCISGEYSASESLKAAKQIKNGQPVYKPKLCPECGAPMTTKSTLCWECRLKNRNSKAPDHKELERLIQSHSLEAIGRIYGVTGKAVRKWCDKYGIKKETHPPIPEKDELILFLSNNSRRKVAEHYSVNPDTVRLWERYYEISFTTGSQIKCVETEEVFKNKKEAAIKMYSNYNWHSASNNITKVCDTDNFFNGYHWVSIPKTIITSA